jgi:hypothetical protein
MLPSTWPVQVASRTGSYHYTSPDAGDAAWTAAARRAKTGARVDVFIVVMVEKRWTRFSSEAFA